MIYEKERADAAQGFRDKSKVAPEEWAESVYRLPTGGHFRFSYAPYTRAMFRSLFDPKTIETNFRLYSRGLKSTVVLLAIGYVIDQAPRRILSLWPTNSQAEKWSKDSLCGELFDTTPCLNFLGTTKGQRKGSQTILHKIFPGGLIDMFGANAPGDMRRAKGSFLYGDEIDAIDETETDEGDQLAIFNKRGDEYPDTIRVFASYPSLLGFSRIDTRIAESDENRWLSTCVKCGGEPFEMKRSMLRYEEGKTHEARLECPRCGALLTDADRFTMAHGQGFDLWAPTREFRGKRGFVGNAMLWPHPVDTAKYPAGFLQLLADQEIAAQKSENPRRATRVLVNTVDAESFDPKSEDEKPPEWKPLYDRRGQYDGIPAGGLVVTGAADLQLNRIEVEWKAWGRDERSWGLDHVVIDGDVRDRGTWELFRRELQRKFKHELGPEIPFSLFFIDGGFWSDVVFQFFADLTKRPLPGVTGKVRAVKGAGASPHPIVSDWRSIAKNLKGHHVGTWQIKDMLNTRLRLQIEDGKEPPEGFMRWNQSYGERYFQQLCSAKCTIDFEKGEEVRKFLNEERLKDEALDLNVYNYAAFRYRRWNFDMIEADLKRQAEEAKEGRTHAPKVAPVRIPSPDFITGW